MGTPAGGDEERRDARTGDWTRSPHDFRRGGPRTPDTGDLRRRPAKPARRTLQPELRTTARRIVTSTALAIVGLGVLLGIATMLALMMQPEDDDLGDQTLAGGRTQPPPYGDVVARSTTTSASSSTTTTASTTSTTTTTTLPTVTAPPTTTTIPAPPPPATRPPTTTGTTAPPPPEPLVDSFSATIGEGCGPNRSPATISWSTTHATSATLGRLGAGTSTVPVDGQQTDVCVRDDGETWRLTASGPGGTTTRDLTINP